MGTNRILKKPNLIRNAIDKQIKQRGEGLTIEEWNQVINALRVQTNYNTKYLEDLHRLLFCDWDQNTSGYAIAADAFDNGFLTEVLEAVEAMTSDVESFRIQVYNLQGRMSIAETNIVELQSAVGSLRTNLDSLVIHHVGPDEPENFKEGDIWYQTDGPYPPVE